MSKTTSDYLGLTIRDNNEFIDTEVDAENFRKIDDEAARLNSGTICRAECTSVVNSDGKTRTYNLIRPEKKSTFIQFQIDGIYKPEDSVKIDGKTVRIKSLSSGAESFENILTSDAPTLGFYDETNSVFYVIPSNPIISDGFSQYTLGFDRISNLPTFTDNSPLGETKVLVCHKNASLFVNIQDGTVIIGDDIVIEKVGPVVKAFGLVRVDYDGTVPKTLLKICNIDGTLDGIAINQGGMNACFYTACKDKRVARLEWMKSEDGRTMDLVLKYIFDLDTGAYSDSGNFWLSIDSEYYSGY